MHTYDRACRTCLKEYSRKEALPPGADWTAAMVADGWMHIEGRWGLCPRCWTPQRRAVSYHPITVLAVAASVIRRYGWVAADEEHKVADIATTRRVRQVFEGAEPLEIHAHDVKRANEAYAWILAQEFPATWGFAVHMKAMLQAFSQSGLVTPDSIAHVSCAIVVHRDGPTRLRRHEAKSARVNSEWVGRPGDKLGNVHARLSQVHTKMENRQPFRYEFVDEFGNAYKWFTTRSHYKPGKYYTIEGATVKRHETYRGTKFTVLGGRVLVLESLRNYEMEGAK
ncbi:hypothetical protein ACFWY5_29780 [Nonomuraea sp. NPDC059007]|uniref:hypothetical protein n=1 Tax=Nonomuraea sp. NPDC059007 TaxID=3346692 RepID=UPI00369DCC02